MKGFAFGVPPTSEKMDAGVVVPARNTSTVQPGKLLCALVVDVRPSVVMVYPPCSANPWMIALAILHSLAYRISPRRTHGGADLSPAAAGRTGSVTASNTRKRGSRVHRGHDTSTTAQVAE